MAHFFGTVRGGRGEALRLGHKTTGLHVCAQSWEGRVDVHLYYDPEEDCDKVRVHLDDASGNCIICLYDGRVDGRNMTLPALL